MSNNSLIRLLEASNQDYIILVQKRLAIYKKKHTLFRLLKLRWQKVIRTILSSPTPAKIINLLSVILERARSQKSHFCSKISDEKVVTHRNNKKEEVITYINPV